MAQPEPFWTVALQTFRFQISLTRSIGSRAPTLEAERQAIRDRPADAPKADALGDGGFAECSGLELEADVREYLEGGRNDGVVRRVGRVKLQPIVLKRGMFTPRSEPGSPVAGAVVRPELWEWLQGVVSGQLPVPRYNGVIEVMDSTYTWPMATWTFVRGLPLKVVGPALNAKTGEIAIEELHIAHEGLRLESAGERDGV
ncbi:phage tail-like protein [Kribbella orskensis]|uniref:Phage tail-like protein n=1 Tax=Kribbella orskensis TaxID=2512216 RepID=A0ABY2BA10_9ACTN|nr:MULTISPECIES: phage tail protein [Kribbella]TCN32773.1 phage tail-like protein [Kribbella sp. VKM Ac-2500]TCO12909.1 phage tail-like protein [Kribbella orskensis]